MQQAIENLVAGRTVLVIAHRLSTVQVTFAGKHGFIVHTTLTVPFLCRLLSKLWCWRQARSRRLEHMTSLSSVMECMQDWSARPHCH